MARLLWLVPLLMSVTALADPTEKPIVLVHTGYLLDASDTPITTDGQPMTFRIFDQSAPVANENKLWEGSCSVSVLHGYYAVTLGGDCGTSLLPSMLPTDQARYLEVTVGSTRLLPRLEVGTVPTAAVATNALLLQGEALADLDQRYALFQPDVASAVAQPGNLDVGGSVQAGSLSTSGDLSVSGSVSSTGAVSGSAVTASGMLSSAALSVTGDGAIGGKLDVTGAVSGSNLAASGTLSSAALSVTGDGAIGGKLDVTGAVSANAFSGDGSALTNLDAAQLSSGTIPDGRLSGTQSATVSLTNSANAFRGSFSGDGSALTSLNATELSQGTVADNRLSPNVALLDANNAFTGTDTFTQSVGIGSTAPPQATLDVAGSIKAQSLTVNGTAMPVCGIFHPDHSSTNNSCNAECQNFSAMAKAAGWNHCVPRQAVGTPTACGGRAYFVDSACTLATGPGSTYFETRFTTLDATERDGAGGGAIFIQWGCCNDITPSFWCCQ